MLSFHDFLERMRHPAAADLVRVIRSFIIQFSAKVPEPEKDGESVQSFLVSTEHAFRSHPLWKGGSEEELQDVGEALEKYLMTKLFQRAFAPLPQDRERDKLLSQKIAALQQFIKPLHLDIPSNVCKAESLQVAEKELQKMVSYKAPRDKLVCILNCCRVINNILTVSSVDEHGETTPPGADDFLPLLIFVIIKANPPQLMSNLDYIQRYRQSSRLVSETAYFFTNLYSAVTFIENMTASSVSMDEAEFKSCLKAASETLEKNGYTHQSQNSDTQDKGIDVSQIAMERLSAEDSKFSDGQKRRLASIEAELEREFQFIFADVGDLKVSDVEILLQEYKNLVLLYKSLCLSASATSVFSTDLPHATSLIPEQTTLVAANPALDCRKQEKVILDGTQVNSGESHMRSNSITEVSNVADVSPKLESSLASLADADSMDALLISMPTIQNVNSLSDDLNELEKALGIEAQERQR